MAIKDRIQTVKFDGRLIPIPLHFERVQEGVAWEEDKYLHPGLSSRGCHEWVTVGEADAGIPIEDLGLVIRLANYNRQIPSTFRLDILGYDLPERKFRLYWDESRNTVVCHDTSNALHPHLLNVEEWVIQWEDSQVYQWVQADLLRVIEGGTSPAWHWTIFDQDRNCVFLTDKYLGQKLLLNCG